jgi:hypothetical protein
MALSTPASRPATARVLGYALAGLVAAGALAGCGPDRTGQLPPPASSGGAVATRSVDPDETAKSRVLAAYTNMRETQIRMSGDGELHTLDLARYAKSQAATDLKKAVLRNQQLGIEFTGRPVMDPKVTAVDISRKTATITDCFDATGWKPVHKSSRTAVHLAKQRLRYPVTARATLEGSTWLITSVTANREKGC